MAARAILGLTSLLLISAAACLAPTEAEVERAADPPSGKADDLTNRVVIIEARGEPRRLEVPALERANVTVDEGESEITLTTDDLRLADAFEDVEVSVKSNQTGDAGDYAAAFVLEVQRGEGTAWERVMPVQGEGDYYWEHATARRDGDELVLTGRAHRTTDVNWGLTRLFTLADVDLRLPGASEITDVRFLVIPTWNFWDWDATGYDPMIQLRPASSS
jgi:hypothetical protein